MKDRSTIMILLGVALIILMGVNRPRDWNIGLPDEVYSARRMMWEQEFDLVVGGDSRVNHGIVPDALARVLGPSLRVANFGFNSIGFDDRYLDHLESLLDKDSAQKTIVLGVTPHTLTPKACSYNQYLMLRDVPKQRLPLNIALGHLLHFFRPYNLKAAFFEPDAGNFSIRQPDGWIASWRIPADETLMVETYRKIFLNNAVSDKITENLLARVRQWSESGITVYAFTPPAGKPVQEMEEQFSKYDEGAFIRRFKESGGIWLDTPREGYVTFDGSHLPAMQAVPFSQALAETLKAKHFNSRGKLLLSHPAVAQRSSL